MFCGLPSTAAQPHTATDCSPQHSGTGERIGRKKARKLRGWDKSSLISEGKKKKKENNKTKTYTSHAKAVTHLSQETDTQLVSTQWLPSEKLKPPFHCYYWSWHYIAWDIPLVSLSCLCPLPALYAPPNYLLGRENWEKKVPVLYKHCFIRATMLVCHHHCFSHKPKIQHHPDED